MACTPSKTEEGLQNFGKDKKILILEERLCYEGDQFFQDGSDNV